MNWGPPSKDNWLNGVDRIFKVVEFIIVVATIQTAAIAASSKTILVLAFILKIAACLYAAVSIFPKFYFDMQWHRTNIKIFVVFSLIYMAFYISFNFAVESLVDAVVKALLQ